jgi:hypothetical protein
VRDLSNGTRPTVLDGIPNVVVLSDLCADPDRTYSRPNANNSTPGLYTQFASEMGAVRGIALPAHYEPREGVDNVCDFTGRHGWELEGNSNEDALALMTNVRGLALGQTISDAAGFLVYGGGYIAAGTGKHQFLPRTVRDIVARFEQLARVPAKELYVHVTPAATRFPLDDNGIARIVDAMPYAEDTDNDGQPLYVWNGFNPNHPRGRVNAVNLGALSRRAWIEAGVPETQVSYDDRDTIAADISKAGAEFKAGGPAPWRSALTAVMLTD